MGADRWAHDYHSTTLHWNSVMVSAKMLQTKQMYILHKRFCSVYQYIQIETKISKINVVVAMIVIQEMKEDYSATEIFKMKRLLY